MVPREPGAQQDHQPADVRERQRAQPAARLDHRRHGVRVRLDLRSEKTDRLGHAGRAARVHDQAEPVAVLLLAVVDLGDDLARRRRVRQDGSRRSTGTTSTPAEQTRVQRDGEVQPGRQRQRHARALRCARATRGRRSSSYVNEPAGVSIAVTAPRLAMVIRRELDLRRRLPGHPVRAVRGRDRQDHHQPAGSAQRLPPGDDHRDLRRAGEGARGRDRRRDHPHRRGPARVLLRRRPERPRRHGLRARRQVRRALPRDRPARADPPPAEARRSPWSRATRSAAGRSCTWCAT